MATDPLSYEIAQVIGEAYSTGLFVSLCTINAPTGARGASGVPTGAYTAVLTNIPCMTAPESTGGFTANETKNVPQILSVAPVHVTLNGYYPQIITGYQAVVDGTIYDILGAESDSQQQMTRLRLDLRSV